MENTIPTTRTNLFTPKSIGIFIAGILLISVIVIGSLSLNKTSQDNNKNNPGKKEELSKKEGNLSPHTLVYGSWNENSSTIMAYDLATGNAGTIADLPLHVKKVTVLSPTQLLYIADTDVKDHGKNISIYDIESKKSAVIYQAADGFFIDDYVISQNKEYLAVWEVQPHPESGILLGGKSRVYTTRVSNSSVKNTIYQEDALVSNPVRYPRGILNNGTVFMDRFLPNYVAGWGYGMSVSNFIGTEKQDIPSMQNGTYSTQPVLSEDGKYLVFSGYNGNKGTGSTLIDGFKRAQLFANTIDLLDTSSLQRQTLANINSGYVYPYVTWDGNNTVVYYQSASNISQNGLYRYSLSSKSATKISTENARFFVESLSQNTFLIGNKQVSDSNVGNLGPTYDSPFTELILFDQQSNQAKQLTLDIPLVQYIDTLPSKYFADSVYSTPNPKFASSKGSNLQIGTFIFKPQIEKERQDEQQDPVTPPPPVQPDPVIPSPVRPPVKGDDPDPVPGPNPDPTSTPVPDGEETIDCQAMARSICKQQHPNDLDARGWCIQDLKPQLKASGQCNASPLYLYGSEGKQVTVTIHTAVSNTYPTHTGKLTLITHMDGSVSLGNIRYDSLKFDYISALRRTPRPTTGIFTESRHLANTVNDIARKLALNEKETHDLQEYAHAVVNSPYAIVSFFDHETSHAILPITFDPKPEVYRNIVFYFKNLDQKPNYSIQPPLFDPIKRHGFTAIEISGIVE